MRKIFFLLCASLGLSLGGCSTFVIEPANHARLTSGKYIHMPLVSVDEERMLRDATERAMLLHSQLRAFDAANKGLETRIVQLRTELQYGARGNRRGSAQVTKTSKTTSEQASVESSKFEVRFAKGSIALDKKVSADLSKALASGSFSKNTQSPDTKQLVVLQVATHTKEGLDSYNALRLGAIHDLFKQHNVPSDVVRLKIVRIAGSQANEARADGNASRTIQLSSIRVGKLES
jgi:hypothetical protein